MKKFEFTLSRMHDYKEQLLDKEKNTLSQLRAQKNRIDDKILALEQEFEIVSKAMQEETKDGITVLKIKCYNFQMENMRRQLKQLRSEQKLMASAVENQLKIVIAASQEVAGLEKLKEKQQEEYNIVQTRAEELVVSEYISSKLIRNKAAGA
ncbi:flagellar export protein FliJ [Oscillospiraceae bacterium PP1C4]